MQVVIENPLHIHTPQFLPENMGAVYDRQGRRFRQNIPKMEQRCQEKWDSATMGDYWWFV